MNAKKILRSFSVILLYIGLVSCFSDHEANFSEIIKVSLRDVGHQLLLTNQDSTSLVKPIITLDKLKYQLSFEQQLSIQPDSLVAIIKSSFQKADLPQYYLIEVIQCEDNEVAYSYKIKQNIEKGIVPCRGRRLPKSCYIINVRFTKTLTSTTETTKYLYVLILSILVFFIFIFHKRKSKVFPDTNDINYAPIGMFKFYPEQNKLIKEATEINLSKKECELLEIFVAHLNQIVKREELTKKVWEDNGVIVGRSLDTYISKLRKKLKDDDSIKLTNVHGVGYKLEII